jgi:hypothetical protein
VLRGYYYSGKRDFSIQEKLKSMFEMRKVYKEQGNCLQEIYKLILNSIYGKTILKPIDTKIKFIKNQDSKPYIRRHYNSIEDIEEIFNSEFTWIKEIKPVSKHFNFCSLGVYVLAMSKRIMNQVFCLAEDNEIEIYYQDTDSGHFMRKDIEKLSELYEKKYNKILIGKDLGQFHSDFPEINRESTYAKHSMFCSKKIYIDELVNKNGDVGYVCRMKGVKQDVIAITANRLFPEFSKCNFNSGIYFKDSSDKEASVWKLYESLYEGETVEFDLCEGENPCFDLGKDYTVHTKTSFKRKISCS